MTAKISEFPKDKAFVQNSLIPKILELIAISQEEQRRGVAALTTVEGYTALCTANGGVAALMELMTYIKSKGF